MDNLTWDQIASGVSDVVVTLSPIIAAVAPEAAVGISIGMKIVQGVIAAEPMAVALYEQIMGGTQPTAEQLAEYANSYEVAYQQLNADINEKLAAMPPV